ncbi:hypothetical protein TNCV_3239861 [Trichonephila clavipes]|nr:hypothetical protein TNCV_3239861 [Trichonephila clavipes]
MSSSLSTTEDLPCKAEKGRLSRVWPILNVSRCCSPPSEILLKTVNPKCLGGSPADAIDLMPILVVEGLRYAKCVVAQSLSVVVVEKFGVRDPAKKSF